MAKVFVRQARYDYQTLKPLVFDLLCRIDTDIIQKKSSVLIKPNLLAPASPDKAVTTHPLIVRAAVEYVLEKGGQPRISDSPGMGSFERIMHEGGYAEALKGLPVDFKPFKESVFIDIGPPYHKIEIAADAVNADVVINLPKLKTHTQMLLTLGVKNMFGCIVGARKPEWHFRAGIDREKFAELLVRIYAAVRPAITLMDGVLAMEGQGPGRSGKARELGVILAGDNAAAIDEIVCRMLGIRAEELLTHRAAERMGVLPGDIVIDGELPLVKDMQFPEMTPLVFGPKGLHGFMRRYLIQRPVCDGALCRHCGECWRICPAKAIQPEMTGLSFDYDRCIRCYCCVEVCPYAALSARETTLGKIARKTAERMKD